MTDLFSFCTGVVPLRPRIAPWMADTLAHDDLASLVKTHGSPLNVQSTEPFVANLQALAQAAQDRGLACRPYFARKANKCLSYVEAARDAGFGIDTASVAEVAQSLDLGVDPERIICTAGVKTDALLALCVDAGVTVILDNDDELTALAAYAQARGKSVPVGLRVAGFDHAGQVLHSRFGYDMSELADVLARIEHDFPMLVLNGLQFHLNGYDASHRASAVAALLPFIEQLQARRDTPLFLDIGGGIPMRYLADADEWPAYLDAHAEALAGRREAITYDNAALGRRRHAETGATLAWSAPDAYPTAHERVQADWLGDVLDADHDGQPLHVGLQRLNVTLRCEPGRSALDGCGMTLARVVHRKHDTHRRLVIGLEMNRTQFRTGFAEVMFDPLMLPAREREPGAMVEGYFTGTYCTESEFIYKRRFRFPEGVARGDLVVLPNTAGYLMHFMESRSHQFDLAHNVFKQTDGSIRLDKIDMPSEAES